MGEKLLTGAETTQTELHHHSLPQYEWQLIKAGKLEYTEQPESNKRLGKVSFSK